jgi:hypothetical protein
MSYDADAKPGKGADHTEIFRSARGGRLTGLYTRRALPYTGAT